ncbi:MAG: hypothetical protein ACE5FT_05185 [Candidatus Nanoarchaeia archaeon]
MSKYVVIIFLLFLVGCDMETCADKACFIEKAQACNTVTLEGQEEYALVKYEAKDCVFTKTIVKMDDSEEEQLRSLIEGTSLSCNYTKENFETRWMYSLYAEFERCEGELKDTLEQLIVAA